MAASATATATAAATNGHSTSVGPNAGSRWWPRSWLIRIKPSNQEAVSGDHRPSHGRRAEISLGGSVGHPVGLIAGRQRHRVLGHLQTPPAVFARRTSIKLGPRQHRRSLQPASDATVTDPRRHFPCDGGRSSRRKRALVPRACVACLLSRTTGVYVVTSEREDVSVSESAQ